MKIQEEIPLAQYTTFKIGGPARFFFTVKSEADLVEAIEFSREKKCPIFVLGGGSNIVIADHGFNGLVLKMEIKGISYNGEKVTAAAGEIWDDFIETTISKGLFGLENLSAIPGTVGATPVQNIGAYGSDVSDFIESVRVLDTKTLEFSDLSNQDCDFAYRDSRFKHEKGRCVVVSVIFKLRKVPAINASYKDISEYFANNGILNPSPLQVRQAVIEIRRNKLPDWKVWGTAGSFFKNPILTKERFLDLKKKYPDLPGFPESESMVKIPLGWIIDKVCSLKGLAVGKVHVYEKQALVVVAMPGATSKEVLELTQKMQSVVREKTGIAIEAEVEWVN